MTSTALPSYGTQPRPRRSRPAAPSHSGRHSSPQHGTPAHSGSRHAAPMRGGSSHSRATPSGPPLSFATTTPTGPQATSFGELELPAVIVSMLTDRGVTVPFAIQSATIPDAMAGRDVLGRGQTGSGKTLAFGLPLLTRTAGQRAQPRQPLTLILTPTRELAQQVTAALTPYAAALRLRCATVVGGLSIGRQAEELRRGVEVVVATPGRLADLVNRGDCRLDQVRIAVVDEADQMADIGFLPQVTALLDQIPTDGQRMLFSATLDREVERLVRRFLVNPVIHSVDPPTTSVVTMEHHLLQVDLADKQATVTEIAARDGRVIMFVDTKHGADRLAKHLLARGVRAAALHGGKAQGQRTRALDAFRTGELDALVATNVAARGIHVDDLDLVVNVDPPADGKDYLHRGGRTARAGQSGTVVTIVLPNQRREVSRLMATAGIRPTCVDVSPGHPDLTRLTGARTPSGIPILPVQIVAPVGGGQSNGGAARRSTSFGGRRRGRGPGGR
jgi:superfamily II DNA/RNA helicase